MTLKHLKERSLKINNFSTFFLKILFLLVFKLITRKISKRKAKPPIFSFVFLIFLLSCLFK